MTCLETRDKLGVYFDGELPAAAARDVAAHVETCPACRAELESLRGLAARIAAENAPGAPPWLWDRIDGRLAAGSEGKAPRIRRPLRALARIAAVVAVAVGLGALARFWPDDSNGQAQASVVDFSVLLDALPLDPPKAFRRFLVLYGAAEIHPSQARSFAPALDFEVPEALPGGFRRVDVYGLRFGDRPGVAARYDRDGEFLAAIFHPTVRREDFGTHRDYPCVVGDHRGHRVCVGEWRLVHVTDAVTCHCVLSRLDETTELPPVLAAVAPRCACSPTCSPSGAKP